MSAITIKFKLDNAAFRDEDGRLARAVVADTVRRVADLISLDRLTGTVMDPNGNSVGSFNIVTSKKGPRS